MDNEKIIPVAIDDRIQAQQNAVQKLQEQAQSNAGRKTNIDEACVQLLIGAFQNGLGVQEACIYAGTSKSAYYDRCKKDQVFLDTMTRARNNLVEMAGTRIVQILKDGDDRVAGPLAFKIFERKMPDEFGQKAPIQDNRKNTNNFIVLTNEQISNIGQQPDIDSADPTELFEALEKASKLDVGTEEEITP